MDIVEMLEKCKEKLGITSDYALAKEFGVRQARIDGYRKGREHPDTFICFKIAEILEISPSKVIAVVEAKTQKNPVKSLYFQQFFMIAGLWITLGVLLPFLGTSTGSAYADGITTKNHINQTYNPIMRSKYLVCDQGVKYVTHSIIAFRGTS